MTTTRGDLLRTPQQATQSSELHVLAVDSAIGLLPVCLPASDYASLDSRPPAIASIRERGSDGNSNPRTSRRVAVQAARPRRLRSGRAWAEPIRPSRWFDYLVQAVASKGYRKSHSIQ